MADIGRLGSDISKLMLLDGNYILVAAIDFGTTYSGYAFSFATSRDNIKMNKNWCDAMAYESYKAPTSVMTGPGDVFHSFGYEAETEYSLLENNEGGLLGYNLFRNFKMLLHKQGTHMESMLLSASGHEVKAIKIFAMALKYLKDHMLEHISQTVKSKFKTDEIRWVLTVPAIWSEESKRFMREAAHMGTLTTEVNSKKLIIALEPEAASIYCQHMKIDRSLGSGIDSGQVDLGFKCGDKILIIDAGGGTVDITAHELLEIGATNVLKEITKPTGGPWGGVKLDEIFVQILNDLIGADFIDTFKSDFPLEWINVLTNFERAKKMAKPDSKSMNIMLPPSFEREYEKVFKQTIKESIKRKSSSQQIKITNGYLMILPEKIKDMFDSVTGKILRRVEEKLQESRLKGLNYILLVGGFGQNKFLQEACINTFSDRYKVLIPEEPQLAIIKGAVAFGHHPEQIRSRVSRYTYGCDCTVEFLDGFHNPTKKVILDGQSLCDNIFQSFVKFDEEIEIGTTKSIVLHPTIENQAVADISIFRTENPHPIYTDESSVTKLAHVILESPNGPFGKDIEVNITFGGTELLVEARDKTKNTDFSVNTIVEFVAEDNDDTEA